MWPNYLMVAGTIGALFGFGLWYDRQVYRWDVQGYHDGYLSLIVALGVLVTIIGIALLDLVLPWNAGAIALVAFTASGLPMVAGSIRRHVAAERRVLEQTARDAIAMAKEALHVLREDDHGDKA